MDPLSADGVAVDVERLLGLRHLVRNLPERGLAPTGRPGGFTGRRRGTGMEAVDVRVFSEGDDMRHVDRNTTARTGVPHVRTFRDEREKSALLIADFRPSMLWGTRRALRSVAAAEALTLAGWRVVEAGGRVGLIALGVGEPLFVPPRGRERGMAQVIGGLAAAHREALRAASEAQGERDPPLDAVLEMAARLTPSGGSVFLASGLDAPGSGFDSLVSAFRRRAQLTVLLVLDAFEDRAPAGSYPFIAAGGRLAWAFVAGSGRPPAADPRLARLERLGIPAIRIDAAGTAEAMVVELDRLDGR